MDLVNIFPTPSQIFRYALHLLSSLTKNYRRSIRKVSTRRTPQDFDVDPTTGFFPPQPLPQLPLEFLIWETAFVQAQEVVMLGEDDSERGFESRSAAEEWRAGIRVWPVLATDALEGNLRFLQRGHLVLSWLVHYYVHSLPEVAPEVQIVIPASLAVPLVRISKLINIAPVLTFADTVLWNYELIDRRAPMSIENMRPSAVFSGTDDERGFYVASARAEWRGIEMLRIVDEFHCLPNYNDITSISKISRDLTRLATIIDEISDVIQAVTNECDPHVFYWAIRPWFKGSGSDSDSPKWIYEGVADSDTLDLAGPSAGQSSVMHALDLFLDIDHKLEKTRFPAPSEQNKQAEHGFMERMRKYMPGKHREYLAEIASASTPIRELAIRTPVLKEPYDNAITSLNRLRTLHMRIAVLYVVSMARSKPGARAGCPVSAMMDRMDRNRAKGGPVRGTGGNDLSLLLKAGRDATKRSLLKDSV